MGVEVQDPHEASIDNQEGEGGGGGSHHHHTGMKVLAPHAVFCDTTSAERGDGVEGHLEVSFQLSLC